MFNGIQLCTSVIYKYDILIVVITCILLWLQMYCHYCSLETVGQKIRLEFQIIIFFSYCDIDLFKQNRGTAQRRHLIYFNLIQCQAFLKALRWIILGYAPLAKGWKNEETRKRRWLLIYCYYIILPKILVFYC